MNLSQHEINGLKANGLQSYRALIRDLADLNADSVTSVRHRRLTYLERAALEGVFSVVEQRLGEVLHRIAGLEDPKDPAPRTPLDQVLEFSETYATLAYLAGEHEGFRLGVAAATRAVQDPRLALHVMGALVDDRQLERLVGQLVTGQEDPEYVSESPQDREG